MNFQLARDPKNRILVCTDSNMAADHVASKLVRYRKLFSEKEFIIRANSEFRPWLVYTWRNTFRISAKSCFYRADLSHAALLYTTIFVLHNCTLLHYFPKRSFEHDNFISNSIQGQLSKESKAVFERVGTSVLESSVHQTFFEPSDCDHDAHTCGEVRKVSEIVKIYILKLGKLSESRAR